MKSANWTAHDCHRSDDRRPRHNHRGKLLEHWGWLQLYYHMVRSYMYGTIGKYTSTSGWLVLLIDLLQVLGSGAETVQCVQHMITPLCVCFKAQRTRGAGPLRVGQPTHETHGRTRLNCGLAGVARRRPGPWQAFSGRASWDRRARGRRHKQA